jgi:glycosyltransferase involved in cell wall biosynthesis
MRVVILSPVFGDAFGQERVIAHSIRLLRRMGHSVGVISDHLVGTAEETDGLCIIPHLAAVNSLTPFGEFKKVKAQVLEFLDGFKPDVIHFIDLFDDRLTRALARRWPLVFAAHTVASTCPASHRLNLSAEKVCNRRAGWSCLVRDTAQRCMETYGDPVRKMHAVLEFMRKKRGMLRHFSIIMANSNYMKDLLFVNGVDPGKILFAPNPVEIEKATSEKSPQEVPLILCIARLVAQKGINVLIDALKRIENLSWNCWICGEGPERESLKQRIESARLNERILLKGKLTFIDMKVLLASNPRMVVQPSLGPESFGMAAAEALSFGIPVIAFDVPALNEIVEHERNGILVSPSNRRELADQIARLLTNDELRERLSSRGVEWMHQNFHPEAHLRATLTAYTKAIMLRNFTKPCEPAPYSHGLAE